MCELYNNKFSLFLPRRVFETTARSFFPRINIHAAKIRQFRVENITITPRRPITRYFELPFTILKSSLRYTLFTYTETLDYLGTPVHNVTVCVFTLAKLASLIVL